MGHIDWDSLLVPTLSVVELMIRGTVMYLMLFLFLRFLPRREMGGIGVADLLMVVLIADAAQNAMSSDYKSITEGLVLVLTILFWSLAVDWLDHKFPHLHVSASPPVLLVKDGRLLRKNMDYEQITEDELMSQLRHKGLDTPQRVAKAYLEGDGKVSVILRK